MPDQSIEELYDERVGELLASTFQSAVEIMGGLVRSGDGGIIELNPGDMTRYEVHIGSRRTHVLLSGEPMEIRYKPIPSTPISFGSGSVGHQTAVLGVAEHQIEPNHPWTAAVWRRLWKMFLERLPMEEWR